MERAPQPTETADSFKGCHYDFENKELVVEIFWCHADSDAVNCGTMPVAGWYWWTDHENDGGPKGPFNSSGEAYSAAKAAFNKEA